MESTGSAGLNCTKCSTSLQISWNDNQIVVENAESNFPQTDKVKTVPKFSQKSSSSSSLTANSISRRIIEFVRRMSSTTEIDGSSKCFSTRFQNLSFSFNFFCFKLSLSLFLFSLTVSPASSPTLLSCSR